MQNTNMQVEQCVLMHVFWKQTGCVLIGACALFRTSTVLYVLLCTSKFYPSRRSSKMIAAMKTNKTHTYTHTQSQIRHTQRKREKMTESLK